MDITTFQAELVKCISFLVAALRKISIYPPKHPIVVESIKSISLSLSALLQKKPTVSISLSADSKILLDGQTIDDKGQGISKELSPYLKKLEIENLSFMAGITEQEIDDFIRVMAQDPELIKKQGGIDKVFQGKSVKNIKIDQFSYVKIKKDQEAVVLDGGLASLDALKAKIKDFSEGKLEKPEELPSIEAALFQLIGAEIKEQKKLSPSLKNLVKKFSFASKGRLDILEALRQALMQYGCAAEDVEKLIVKLSEEIAQGPAVRAPRVSKDEVDALHKEHEDLKSQFSSLKQQLAAQTEEIAQLKKSNQQIRDEKERIENIVHHMADGVVVVDPAGKILLMNQQAEALLGSDQQKIGSPIKELVKDEHLLTLVKDIPVDSDGVIHKDIELFSQNESTKKVLRTSSAVIEDHNGKTVGMVTTLNDITKQRQLDQLKSNFVANVSHELRTPLVAIDKAVGLILSKATGELSLNQEQFLTIAERNLKRLSLLINDLLDISKLEAGKMKIERSPCAIGKIIQESTDSLALWAKSKTIALKREIEENIPEVSVDGNRIIQVLNNLIGNAIKFTPANGTITVKARYVQEKGEVEVNVSDTGPGIDAENLAKIFDKFYQITEKTASDVKGTGIGLSISKEIVALHGGRIWAESQKGVGTTLSFVLPLHTEDSLELKALT